MFLKNPRSHADTCGLEQFLQKAPKTDEPILLFQAGEHAIYWLGIDENTAFRCNVYLIRDGEEGLLLDPGGKNAFVTIKNRLTSIMPPRQLKGLILSHQDPDIAASMPDWLELNPSLQIFSSPRIHVLLRYYQLNDYKLPYDVERDSCFQFASGRKLHFIPSPFLHSPGAFATFDATAGYLFSGDIWSALDLDWRLVADDFAKHKSKLDLFNKDYMASKLAARGFVDRLTPFAIAAILPQHGSLLPKQLVSPALDYLWNLDCGLDLFYDQTRLSSQSPFASPISKSAQHQSSSWAEHSAWLALAMPCAEEEKEESELKRQNILLGQALNQASRLAKLGEEALRNLSVAKQELEANEARLSEAQTIAQLGYWEWNMKTDELKWSEQVYQIFGLEAREFGATSEAFFQSVHPDDRSRVELAVKQAIADDSPYSVKHRVLRPDGEIRQVHERGKISRDNNGQATRILGTVHDITELTQLEEEMRVKNKLIGAIQRLQAQFIAKSDWSSLLQSLLDELLQLTESKLGFVGEVERTAEGQPFIRNYALSDLTSDLTGSMETQEAGRQVQRKSERLEFHGAESLFGYAVISGKTVISNDPLADPLFDPQRLGLPVGHLLIGSFLGIPVYSRDQLVGQICLLNRDGGYYRELLDCLNPLVFAFGQIIVAHQERLARLAAEEKLSQLAKLDGLLGISNRRAFDEYFASQYSLSIRHNKPLSLILLDVDHFKLFNDHYGHQAGDDCLISIAKAIKKGLRRPSDMVARYGGEEFCCVLPGTDGAGALKIAKDIQKNIKAMGIPHLASSVSDKVTLSMGISSIMPDTKIADDEFFALADQALYQAKAAGRDQIIFIDAKNLAFLAGAVPQSGTRWENGGSALTTTREP